MKKLLSAQQEKHLRIIANHTRLEVDADTRPEEIERALGEVCGKLLSCDDGRLAKLNRFGYFLAFVGGESVTAIAEKREKHYTTVWGALGTFATRVGEIGVGTIMGASPEHFVRIIDELTRPLSSYIDDTENDEVTSQIPANPDEAIKLLYQYNLIDEATAKGLLILLGCIDVSQFDSVLVKKVELFARTGLRQKLANHTSTVPFLRALASNSQNDARLSKREDLDKKVCEELMQSGRNRSHAVQIARDVVDRALAEEIFRVYKPRWVYIPAA